MKLCPVCEPPHVCCDFCKHYDFNGDDRGRYTENGWCRLHEKKEWPGGICDDFHCAEADK